MKTNWFTAVWLCATAVTQALAATPGFDVVDTAGTRHRLADYRGKPVVLNFWATWCVPCIQEIPEIAAFRKAHPEVVVLGVAEDAKDATKVKQFAAKVGHDYPLVLSDDAVDKQLGTPVALPTTRVYDAKGNVAYDQPGRVTRAKLEQLTRDAPGRGVSASR